MSEFHGRWWAWCDRHPIAGPIPVNLICAIGTTGLFVSTGQPLVICIALAFACWFLTAYPIQVWKNLTSDRRG